MSAVEATLRHGAVAVAAEPSEPEWFTTNFGDKYSHDAKPDEYADEVTEGEAAIYVDPEWPTPPRDTVYHGVMGRLAKAVAPLTEADPIGILVALMAEFGTYAGPRFRFSQGGWQRTNIFAALVGETSIGRKGTAFSVAREILNLEDPTRTNIYIPGLGSGEGLTTYLEENKPDPRALIYEPEMGRFLTAADREGSSLSPTIRNAWDGATLGRFIAQKSQSGKIESHHVGMLSSITRIELSQKLKSTEAANGFGNRFMWIAVRRPQLLPFTPPIEETVRPLLPALSAAFDFTSGDEQVNMRFTIEAREVWKHFYKNRPRRAGLIAALTARAEPYVVRLAMIYALLDRSIEVNTTHLQSAMALWEYSERSAVYIFGDSTGNKHADALYRMLQEAKGIPVGWNDAKHDLGFRAASDMNQTVDLLVKLGKAQVYEMHSAEDPRTGGRPGRTIALAGVDA